MAVVILGGLVTSRPLDILVAPALNLRFGSVRELAPRADEASIAGAEALG
jgi:Cu/Ag efflux pump CusA